VAAVIIAVLTIYFYKQPNDPTPMAENTSTHSQEEIRQAFDQAKAALLLVGGGLNKGKTHAVSITRFNDAQQIIKEQ
jgi:hypothetical protein